MPTFALASSSSSASRADVLESGYVAATKVVGTNQIEATAGNFRLIARQHLSIHNKGPSIIYVGPEGVTTQTGRPIFVDQILDMPIGDIGVFLVAESEDNSVTIQELA